MKEKTALIVCHGEPPSKKLVEFYLNEASFLVGVDGGCRYLLENGFRPDCITGDFDSRGQVPPTIALYPTPDQNWNDFQKCLSFLLEKGFQKVFVLGAQGKRADHSLTNLYLLSQFQFRLEVILVDAYGKAWVGHPETRLSLNEGKWVSLFALGSEPVFGLSTQGLLYPLTQAMLLPGSPLASLNSLVGESACVSYQKGCLLIIQSFEPSFEGSV